ncbi:drebrin-like a [Aplochiton taeniatus]
MAVNLSKNGVALQAAYDDVVDGKSETNWALFTYEGNSNDIRLAQKGEGGLEEMVEELSSGKVMYAFCRVHDPNSGLAKYVLINWTGEGVKDSRKGLCANHVSSMANFLKGAHVTVNARGEDDVDPVNIMGKVAKASGANFNFHKQAESQAYSDAPRGPVGSVYRKINAVDEIQRTNKDNFWAQAQIDEELRQKEESKRAEMERQKLERERKKRDDIEAAERKKRGKERASQIAQQKTLEKKLEEEKREEDTQQKEQQENVHQKPQNKGINSAASVQKAKEAQSLISQRTFDPMEAFKQREQSFELNKANFAAAGRPGRLQSPFLFQKSTDREDPVEIQVPKSPAPLVPESRYPVQSTVEEWSDGFEDDEDAGSANQDVSAVEEWSDGFEDDEDAGSANQEEPGGQVAAYKSHTFAKAEETEELYEDIYESTPTAEKPGADSLDHGLCARALYDYQAADDSEITFDPEDVITEIDKVDEGWWSGRAPNGHYGMFPANYVELV